MQPQTMPQQDILKLVLDALIAQRPAAVPAPASDTVGAANSSQLLQAVLAALAAKAKTVPANAAATSTSSETAPPVLSPIDSWLGGQALAGKKTALAVVGYGILSVLQAVGVAGTATGTTATTTGQILTTLIAAFGALGGVSKIDRVVQTLGVIASAPPASPK